VLPLKVSHPARLKTRTDEHSQNSHRHIFSTTYTVPLVSQTQHYIWRKVDAVGNSSQPTSSNGKIYPAELLPLLAK